MVPSNTRSDLEAAIRTLQADSGRAERTTINGLPALNFIGAKQGASVEATAITVNGNDYILRPLAKSADARNRSRSDTQAIIQSVRTMSANDIAQARPYKLKIVTATRSGLPTLVAEAARATPDLRNVEGQLRLLNQIYPAGEINAGQLVKTIQ